MIKLLRANFSRLKKDKPFLAGTAFMLIVGIALPLYLLAMKNQASYDIRPDEAFFVFTIFAVILSAAFSALFIGTEHSDGTIRNKIVVGHTKAHVYFSNLLTCVITSLIMCLSFLIPYLCISLPLLGKFEMKLTPLILTTIASLGMIVVFTSLFVLVSMLSNNKALSAVICLVGALALTFSGYFVSARLNEPETYDGFVYTDENGDVIKEEAMPNANYLSGTKRIVYEKIYDLNPGGQVVQFLFKDADNPELLIGYNALMTVLISGLGVLIFRKKDLK